MRLGILGGTFDPVHAGHLSMARAAARAARLDRVLLVPCFKPPHKERADLTDPYHRFGMLATLVASDPLLAISSIEMHRGGVSYTVDTLRAIEQAAPGADLFLVVGSDSYVEISSWREPEEILARAAVVIVPRPGAPLGGRGAGLPALLGSALRDPGEPFPSRVRGNLPYAGVVHEPPVEISSTEIRNRVRDGRAIGGMVPESVEAYIRRQGLYGPSPIV